VRKGRIRSQLKYLVSQIIAWSNFTRHYKKCDKMASAVMKKMAEKNTVTSIKLIKTCESGVKH
jgi:hypothetical protein